MLDKSLKSKLAEATKRYMGCEGGDPNADIWLCAMEHGGSYQSKRELVDGVLNAHDKGIFLGRSEDIWREMVKWRHGQNYAKLIDEIHGNEHLNGGEYRNLSDDEINSRLGGVFKLNLYPIAFRNLDDNSMLEHLGFEKKQEYYSWASSVRDGIFQNLLAMNGKPKVLICAGLGMESDFQHHFLPEECTGTSVELNDKLRYVYYDADGMHVFITPALTGGGGRCLTSGQSISLMGSVIAAKFLPRVN